MPKRNPKQFFLILTAILISGGTFAAAYVLHLHLLIAYLVSLNVLTFLMYGYDKRQSIQQGGRVPEMVLHLLALVGGSPAALTGQLSFRHKTRKRSFRLVFIGIVLLQIVTIAALIYFNNRQS